MKAKTKQKGKMNVVQKEASYLRKKMIASRLTGIFTCLLALASVAVYYLKSINEWLCIIALAYCLGTIFVANSFIQDVKVGNPWQRVNGVCAIVFFILVVFLIVYGFVTHQLNLQF